MHISRKNGEAKRLRHSQRKVIIYHYYYFTQGARSQINYGHVPDTDTLGFDRPFTEYVNVNLYVFPLCTLLCPVISTDPFADLLQESNWVEPL